MSNKTMQKLKMHSLNLTQENMARIRELFPGCVTEAKGEDGKVGLAVDFDLLRQELSESIVEGPQERYHLDWPGKRKALLAANAPIAKTLRPCRDESVDFDTTKNLYIEGDNLEALKLLQETYLGKVKMIYIDPPYNTGKDFIYKDNFAENTDEFLKRSNQKDEEGNRLVTNTESNGRFHSDWLSMMYPRLKLARNLLRDDGVIFISIDDNEVHNLRKVCDEVFGGDNFVTEFIWERAFAPKNDAKYVSNSHDYILMYTKELEKFEIGKFARTQEANERYKNLDNDPRGAWASDNLTVKSYSLEYDYAIITPGGRIVRPTNGRCWFTNKQRMQKLIEDGRIWFGEDGNNMPRLKRYLSDVQDGMTPTSILWHKNVGHSQEGRQKIKELFEDKAYFDGPKPVRLLSRLMAVANLNSNDIILDFFSGSATTAHAVMQLNAEDGGNRQFIMVQLPEPCDENAEAYKAGFKTIAEIGKERIRRAGAKIKEELAAKQNQNSQGSLLEGSSQRTTPLDIGFRVLKVDSSNMADVYYTPDTLTQTQLSLLADNIKIDRLNNPEDLIFQVLLDWGVDLTLPIRKETILDKTVFFVDENALVACFDTGLTEDLVKELALAKPMRMVFRDAGFASDAVKINVTQIFKQLSPHTEVKVI